MPICHVCKLVESPKSRCAECNRAYMREYRAANLEKVKAGQRNHYARNREDVIQKVRTYAEENKAKIKTRNAKKYDENKEARRSKIKEWQENNPEKYKASLRIGCLNRIARKAKASGRHTIKDIRKMYDDQNGECVACKKSILDGYHVDHIKPLAKGGDNWPSNLQLLCPTCNMKKSNMSMEEFMARNFGRT